MSEDKWLLSFLEVLITRDSQVLSDFLTNIPNDCTVDIGDSIMI